MALGKMRFWEELVRSWAHIFYHVVVVTLSAVIALSLPIIVSFIARNILVYWSFIGNEKMFLISLEMALAIFLIFFTNYIARSWKDRKLSNMAKKAGLVFVSSTKGFYTRRRIRKFKEKQGFAREIMCIGSTGFHTFVDPQGDLHHVIQSCREAKIMLLNPYSEGASARAKSILDPDITLENFKDQMVMTIDFLKRLRAAQKIVKLKLYQDIPFLRLAILGDYIWMQHYHTGLDVEIMPEYVFMHGQNLGSLYVPLYQYFLTRWNNPEIPEYDLESDELIYRDSRGNIIKKERFNEIVTEVNSNTEPNNLNHHFVNLKVNL